MMNKEQKKQYINDMTTQFDKTEAVIVTHYQGLTVNQLDDLKKKCASMVLNLKLQIIELQSLL
jgi:large subunit ribosomal protein L10